MDVFFLQALSSILNGFFIGSGVLISVLFALALIEFIRNFKIK